MGSGFVFQVSEEQRKRRFRRRAFFTVVVISATLWGINLTTSSDSDLPQQDGVASVEKKEKFIAKNTYEAFNPALRRKNEAIVPKQEPQERIETSAAPKGTDDEEKVVSEAAVEDKQAVGPQSVSSEESNDVTAKKTVPEVKQQDNIETEDIGRETVQKAQSTELKSSIEQDRVVKQPDAQSQDRVKRDKEIALVSQQQAPQNGAFDKKSNPLPSDEKGVESREQFSSEKRIRQSVLPQKETVPGVEEIDSTTVQKSKSIELTNSVEQEKAIKQPDTPNQDRVKKDQAIAMVSQQQAPENEAFDKKSNPLTEFDEQTKERASKPIEKVAEGEASDAQHSIHHGNFDIRPQQKVHKKKNERHKIKKKRYVTHSIEEDRYHPPYKKVRGDCYNYFYEHCDDEYRSQYDEDFQAQVLKKQHKRKVQRKYKKKDYVHRHRSDEGECYNYFYERCDESKYHKRAYRFGY